LHNVLRHDWKKSYRCRATSSDRIFVYRVNPPFISVLFFLAVVVVCAAAVLLRKPQNREAIRHGLAEAGRRGVALCQSLRRRRADDRANLLGGGVSVAAFGSIPDDDDVYLILA
jgi:hypothetical protein